MDHRLARRITSQSFTRLAELLPRTLAVTEQPILATARIICRALRVGRKVMFCGNGGSAADAQHLAAELVGKFYRQRRALPALALTTDTSVLTSVGNDVSFDEIFSRQVEALGRPGDVLVCLSTSGRSANILTAARTAQRQGIKVVALVGDYPRRLRGLADAIISVPSADTPRIQELHALIGHIICQIVEIELA